MIWKDLNLRFFNTFNPKSKFLHQFNFNILLIQIILFISSVSLAQNKQEKLDSLEKVFSSMDKSQPGEIIKLGNTIVQQSASDEQKSRILGILAVIYFEKNDLKKSTELLFEAKNAAEKTGNHELIAQMYGSIAHQYIQLKLNDKAKFYLEKAIDEINKMPEGNNKQFLKGLSYLEFGNVEIDNKNYKTANKNYKQSLVHFQQMIEPGMKITYHYRRSLYNIGNSYVYMNQPDSAEIFLEKTLKIKDDKNKDLNFFVYNSLAKIYSEKGFYKRSIDSLQVVLDNPEFNDKRLKSEIYLNLSQNYKKLGNNEQYYFYNEKYIQLKDSLQSSGLNAINSAINAEQKDFSIALSKSDRNNKLLIAASISFLILLLIVIIYLIYKRKKERVLFERIIIDLKYKLESPILPEKEKSIKDENDLIPNAVEEEILSKLEKFENSQKFTNPKLTISTLAVQLKTNTTYLSEVINNYKGKNFNTYINELRIKYICEKIYTNPEYLNYKISYLAEDSGFTSHSSFATVFKTITGISPSVFLREAAKHESYKPKSI